MSHPRDDGSPVPGLAGEQSHAPGAMQPRKPRIEVLEAAPAAISTPSLAKSSSKTTAAAGAASREALLTQASLISTDQGHRADTSPARKCSGLFRSRTILLLLIAVVVITGLLLYTFTSSKREVAVDADGTTKLSSVDAKPSDDQQNDSDIAKNREPDGPSVAARIEELVPKPAPAVSIVRTRATAPETRQAAVDGTPEEALIADSRVSGDNGDASKAVLAFYSALSAGDGASAAQLVVPEKRQSGPLSTGALSRYYSSFRRPLRVRRVAHVNAKMTLVAYDYVLADGRFCRGEAAVDVVQRDGVSLVSRIRTRGPC